MPDLRAFSSAYACRRPKRPVGASNAQSLVRRTILLLGTSIAAYAAVAPTAASAQNECGVPPPGGGTVTCTPAGNPYPNGIDYDPVVADLTVVLQPGVVVTNAGTPAHPNGVEIGSSVPGVDLSLQAGTQTQITTTAANHDGVDVVATDGTVTVAVDDVTTSGANSRAIVASGRGTTSVTADTVSTLGDNADGISAEEGNFLLPGAPATVGGTSVTVNSVSTVGNTSTGIIAFSENGAVVVDVGTVTTAGNYSNAVIAITAIGDIRVTSGSITTQGAGSIGIDALIFPFPDEVVTGTIVVDSGTVVTSGDAAIGISASSPVSDVTVISNSVSTAGDDAPGIVAFIDGQLIAPGTYAYGEGDIVIDSGSVTTLGDYSTGITASGTDNVTITSANVSTAGERSPGINARTYFDGDIAITSTTVSTLGAGSGGILAETEDGAIVITSASVTTAGNTILGQPGILAAGAHGIEAISATGPITIASTAITTGGTNANGIVAETTSGAVDITSGTITAADGRGIEATTTTGDIAIESGSVTTVGGLFSDGIFAESESGEIVIDSGSVSVGHGVGIFVISGSGDVEVTSDDVTVTGDLSPGIALYGDYYVGGDITLISGSVETSGRFSNAIDVESRGLVSVQSTSIVTTGDGSRGIEAGSNSGGVVIDSGTIATSGANARGMQVNVYYEAGVVIRSGTITTVGDNGDGIVVATFGDDSTGDFTITSTSVSTQGHRSIGIYAYHAGSGDIVVTSGSVTTAGDTQPVAYGTSHAIELHANSGSVTVTSNTVRTTGSGSAGIVATSESGPVTITSGTATTTGANAHGIVADSGSAGVIVDSAAVSVAGAGANAIMLQSGTTSTLTVRGLTVSTQGFAVQADGGPATVNILAGGTVRGRVDLTEGADRIVNAGTFDAIGTSLFGGGADLFTNSGVTRSVNGAAVLTSVDTFNSSGRIEMNDGAANDRLTIGGSYNGLAGSRLAIDVDFAAGTADVLVVTGAATGTTGIEATAIGQAQTGFRPGGILLVDAGAGTQAGAFTLVGATTTNNAFISSGLFFDAANFDFLLANAPNQPVFETAVTGEIMSELWYRGADAVSAQLEAARDGGGLGVLPTRGRFGGWAQVVGASREREASQAFGTTIFDVGYEQDYRGFQGGLDRQAGPAIFGLTFGVGRSDVEFETSPSRIELETLNAGAYAQVRAGSFFVNALFKVDWIDAETDPGPGLETNFDATAIGARLAAGLRLDLGSLWVEPVASLAWVNTDISDYVSGGATVAFEDMTSLRGSLGMRVGGDFPAGAGTISPSLGIHAIEELDGDGRTDFAFGSTLALEQEPPGTFGRATAGLTYRTGTLEAFVRGEMDFGGETDGRGARAGLRLRF